MTAEQIKLAVEKVVAVLRFAVSMTSTDVDDKVVKFIEDNVMTQKWVFDLLAFVISKVANEPAK